jgi:hypothetical protein
LTVGSTVDTYTISGMTGGTTNLFTVAAYNKYGVGPSTDTLSVVAGQEPDQVSEPSVIVDQHYTVVSWTTPFDNYSPILGYRVLLKDFSAAFVDATYDCNGEYATMTSQTECLIPMRTLLDTYGLVYPDNILVKIVAVNDRGDSAASDENTVAPIVEDAPRKMLPIVDGDETTNLMIHLEWAEPDDGGSQVLGYIIYYKKVTDADYVELVGGQDSAYDLLWYKITLGVEEGVSYSFIAKAFNRWGLAYEYSDETVILAATVPVTIDTVETSIDGATGGILVQWQQPHH